MPLSDFKDLYNSLCELANVSPSPLERDDHGVLGFAVDAEGVTVGFMEAERDGHPGALMVVDFGEPDSPREPETLREVLDSNFLLFGMGSPFFARNPLTGGLSLHQSWVLAHVQVQDIYRDMLRAMQAAARWKPAPRLGSSAHSIQG